MQLLQGVRGFFKKRCAVAVVIVAADEQGFLDEIVKFKDALKTWNDQRTLDCEMIQFTVMVKDGKTLHLAEKHLADLYSSDSDTSKILTKTKCQVAMHEIGAKTEKPKKEYALS